MSCPSFDAIKLDNIIFLSTALKSIALLNDILPLYQYRLGANCHYWVLCSHLHRLWGEGSVNSFPFGTDWWRGTWIARGKCSSYSSCTRCRQRNIRQVWSDFQSMIANWCMHRKYVILLLPPRRFRVGLWIEADIHSFFTELVITIIVIYHALR